MQLFDKLDTNGDGVISRAELYEAMRTGSGVPLMFVILDEYRLAWVNLTC